MYRGNPLLFSPLPFFSSSKVSKLSKGIEFKFFQKLLVLLGFSAVLATVTQKAAKNKILGEGAVRESPSVKLNGERREEERGEGERGEGERGEGERGEGKRGEGERGEGERGEGDSEEILSVDDMEEGESEQVVEEESSSVEDGEQEAEEEGECEVEIDWETLVPAVMGEWSS